MSVPQLSGNPKALTTQTFDAIVIGGGITGVSITRELATRGHRVLLVERDDYGSGTSSATTKYLHGGIRYLEQLDISIVRESLRERRRFALAAPHLVSQREFALPVWKWSKPGRFLLTAGAAAYDALSFDRNRGMPPSLNIGHPRWMGRAQTLARIPWLDPTDLQGAVVITDTLNVHPERLLLSLLFDAVSAGAESLNHVGVTGFDIEPSAEGFAVRGVQVEDRLTGSPYRFRSPVVINAAGPWVTDVLSMLDRPIGPAMRPSKGVHILTRPMATSDAAPMSVMARARSGRHVVVSPWQNRLFIGPTDTPVDRSTDDVAACSDDVADILRVVNDCRSPSHQLHTDDIADTTMGIRPLIGDRTTSNSSKLSRRHHIDDHAGDGVAGLYSVFGGKWTTGRATAEAVVNQVFGHARSRSTRTRPVDGIPDWGIEPAEVFEYVDRAHPESSCSQETREHLTRLYGTRASLVLDIVTEHRELGARVSDRPGCDDILAQVVVAVTVEGARTLDDIVQRRLVLGTLGPISSQEISRVARIAAPLLGWSDDGRPEAAAEMQTRNERRTRWRPG